MSQQNNPLFLLHPLFTFEGVDVNTIEEVDNIRPNQIKKYHLNYVVKETRKVTVKAKTLEEAYKKGTEEVIRRQKRGDVRERFDDEFKLAGMDILTDVLMTKFLPYQYNYVSLYVNKLNYNLDMSVLPKPIDNSLDKV